MNYSVPFIALLCCSCANKEKQKEDQQPKEPAATKEAPAAKEAAATEEPAPEPSKPEVTVDKGVTTVAKAGFATPESVLWDPKQDIYLVSNINGSPTDEDDNGFISKVSPDGEIIDLKWIDGSKESIDLNAPKGMALTKDLLWVADIDRVRMFDRESGESKGEILLKGSTFINDVASHGERVWVTDSGLKPDFSRSNTDAIWTIENGKASDLSDTSLSQPNGITTNSKGDLYVATFGADRIWSFSELGDIEDYTELKHGRLDGLEIVDDKHFVVSSWEASAVFIGPADGPFSPLIEDLESPADIGYDAKRRKILVPLFKADALVFVPLPAS